MDLEPYDEMVPDNAASMERGSPFPCPGTPKQGGSTRANEDEEMRLRDKMPALLLLGDRPVPAGADKDPSLLILGRVIRSGASAERLLRIRVELAEQIVEEICLVVLTGTPPKFLIRFGDT